MKNIKFSRLFAAVAFVAVLAFAGCKNQPEESSKAIEGTWVNSAEKYEISSSEYKNYSHWNPDLGDYDADWHLYYSTNKVEIVEGENNTGFVYAQFNDADHIGYGAEVGQWYALYYFELTDSSVKLLQAYKNGGKPGCASLEEAKTEYTLENGYFPLASASECVKE